MSLVLLVPLIPRSLGEPANFQVGASLVPTALREGVQSSTKALTTSVWQSDEICQAFFTEAFTSFCQTYDTAIYCDFCRHCCLHAAVRRGRLYRFYLFWAHDLLSLLSSPSSWPDAAFFPILSVVATWILWHAGGWQSFRKPCVVLLRLHLFLSNCDVLNEFWQVAKSLFSRVADKMVSCSSFFSLLLLATCILFCRRSRIRDIAWMRSNVTTSWYSGRQPLLSGRETEDVVGVVTPLVRGGAQVLHGDQVVELSVLLKVHVKEEVEEDGEGQIEVESGEVNSRRDAHGWLWTWMRWD